MTPGSRWRQPQKTPSSAFEPRTHCARYLRGQSFSRSERKAFAEIPSNARSTHRADSGPIYQRSDSSNFAREFVGPWQQRLIGKGLHQPRSTRGIGRREREFEMMTPLRSHLLLLPGNRKGWLPPPCRCRRPLIFRYGTPLRELASNALELKSCRWVHQQLTSRPEGEEPGGAKDRDSIF